MGIIITQEVRKESRTWNGLTWLLLPFLVPSVLIHEALIQEKEKEKIDLCLRITWLKYKFEKPSS